MSLLQRIGSGGTHRDPDQFNKSRFLRRELLRTLADDADMHQRLTQIIEAIAADSEYELTDRDRDAMQDDLAGFLDHAARREARPRPPTPIPVEADWQTIFDSIKRDLSHWLLTVGAEDLPADFDSAGVRSVIDNHLTTHVFPHLSYEDGTPVVLSRTERRRIRNALQADLTGWGPLEQLISDDKVTEIFVYDSQRIFVRRNGLLEDSGLAFDAHDHLTRVITRIFAPLNIRLDMSHPYAHARLPDGSRVTAVVPTLAMDGAALTLRKFNPTPLSAEQLIQFGSISEQGWDFLRGLVLAGANILITGGPFSGRTSLLNILMNTISDDLRIVVVETRTELRTMQPLVTRLVEVPRHIAPDLSMADLYRAAAELGPDFVVVGDGPQTGIIEFLRLFTRVWGVLAVVEAYDPGHALNALYDRALAEPNRPGDDHIRTLIARGINVVVHVEQLPDGRRVVSRIAEVGEDLQSGAASLTDLFRFERSGQEQGRIRGALIETGAMSSSAVAQLLRDAGLDF